ncbi:MAG TPA: glycosyltransferase family 4 protein [Coleofasciculaceae cyanobacterium]|jgi:glycosyltransferase involved in cell wall biosynthesis
MKIAYITVYDSTRLTGLDEWSGTGYHIAEALRSQSIDLNYAGPLKDSICLKGLRKIKRHYYQTCHQKRYEKNPDPQTLKYYAKQVEQKLSPQKNEIVFSATVDPIAYLECDRPMAFWADATFAGIADFYPQYSNLHSDVVHDWHQMEKLALEKCQLAIYSSDWAARSAIEFYQANPDKVKVVPFGANIKSELDFSQIKDAIEVRPSNVCKLLFMGMEWLRKGGDVAYAVAKQLNQSGLKTELIVVGCQPLINEPIPEFVKPLGFISKSTLEGKKRLNQLIIESHFLILPSLADCTPMVFPEANSLGVPCLSTKVGGIPSMIHDDENGKLFACDSDIVEYCDYITNLFSDYSKYKQLAYASYSVYKSHLNWQVSGQKVKSLLTQIV